MKKLQPPNISKGIIIIVGGYGSGKSEVSINLARHFVTCRPSAEQPVSIVDLDIVNPYFRSRDVAEELEKLGINAINPKGGQQYADLPIILPEIKGVIENHQGKIILDVGGDDTGARVLSSLSNAFTTGTYELLLVLNASRPFTSSLDGCLKIINEIESASRLKFTGIICNTHLMDDTSQKTILNGLKLSHKVSEKTKLPILFLSIAEQDLESIDLKSIDVPILTLNRFLLKPWEKK